MESKAPCWGPCPEVCAVASFWRVHGSGKQMHLPHAASAVVGSHVSGGRGVHPGDPDESRLRLWGLPRAPAEKQRQHLPG